jgi:tetratricopeptide (TPR) repeat protein
MFSRQLLKPLYFLVVLGGTAYFLVWAYSSPSDAESTLHLIAAKHYMSSNLPDEALAELSTAWQTDDEDGYLAYCFGLVYQDLKKDLDSAIIWYNISTELDTEPPWAYFRLGQCLLSRNDTSGAERSWSLSTLRTDSDYLFPLRSLSELYRKQKRWGDAIAVLQKAVAMVPKDFDSQFYLALTLKDQGNYQESKSHFFLCATIDSTRYESFFHLGILAYYEGKCTEAVHLLSRSLQHNNRYSFTHYYLGLCQQKLGQIDEAVARYRHATTLQPFFPECWFELVRACLGQGRRALAMETLERAKRAFPRDAALHQKLKTLVSLTP